MSGYGNLYVERVVERCPDLVHNAAWPAFKAGLFTMGERDDEYAYDESLPAIIAFCRQAGITVGPATCEQCGKPQPGTGDVVWAPKCEACVDKEARRVAEETSRKAAWDAMSEEEKALLPRMSLDGLRKRNVQ